MDQEEQAPRYYLSQSIVNICISPLLTTYCTPPSYIHILCILTSHQAQFEWHRPGQLDIDQFVVNNRDFLDCSLAGVFKHIENMTPFFGMKHRISYSLYIYLLLLISGLIIEFTSYKNTTFYQEYARGMSLLLL